MLLAFYDYPAEHRIRLRTTNPIESTFATVRLRQRSPRAPGRGQRGGDGFEASRMLRPQPCLYAAGMAGHMTCGICGPLRFGLPGDAWHGGWFLALAVPEIPA